jgi:hypothetical protein
MGVMPSGTTGWNSSGIWSYSQVTPIYYRDCAGWTTAYASANDQASYWHPNQFPDNSWCYSSRPILCCD